jgi:hypothetical protein
LKRIVFDSLCDGRHKPALIAAALTRGESSGCDLLAVSRAKRATTGISAFGMAAARNKFRRIATRD